MKGKLIKKYGEFMLLKGDIIIASSDKNFNGEFYLSKQNCDEIFGVVNLDQIKIDYINQELKGCDEETREKYYSFAEYDGEIYIRGIEKGMELNKDKVFTLADIEKAIYMARKGSVKETHNGYGLRTEPRFELDNLSSEEIIQFLQQPTQVEVEFDSEETFIYEGGNSEIFGSYTKRINPNSGKPKPDSEGNLILRKL